MLSLISKQRLELERAALIKDLDPEGEISNRLKAAKDKGDLSENMEYEIAVADANKARIRISEIDELLSSSDGVMQYGNTIGIGSFITVVYELEDGKVLDLGLYLFDLVGSATERIISPTSELGHRIQGTTGGMFTIKIDGGKTAKVKVTLESESRIKEYLEEFPIGTTTFEALLEKGEG